MMIIMVLKTQKAIQIDIYRYSRNLRKPYTFPSRELRELNK